MKKFITLLAALLLLLSLMAGCKAANPKSTVDADYVPIPELTDPTIPSEKPREFPAAIEDTKPVPTVTEEKNVTPEEFRDILLVENRSPFTGQFMECEPEDFERRDDVYALAVTNISGKTIETVTLRYMNGEKELTFVVEMLPAGWTVVAMDTEGTAVTQEKLTYVSGQVQYLTVGREVTDEVALTETRNGTIIVKNMSGEEMQTVVVYYRDVDYQGNILAGRCFSAVTTGSMIPGWQEELETDQWLPSCVIVNVVVLDKAPE